MFTYFTRNALDYIEEEKKTLTVVGTVVSSTNGIRERSFLTISKDGAYHRRNSLAQGAQTTDKSPM